MKRLIYLFLLWMPIFLMAQPAARNFTLLGELSYSSTLNDVWGHVDAEGNEYALVGLGDGVSVVDVTDPTLPVELFHPIRPYSFWRDLKTWGDFAYVSNETSGGLMVLDLSNLPNSMPVKDTIIQGVTTIHNLWVDEQGYLYLVGSDQFNGGVVILDVATDPWHPAFVGAYDEAYVHDIYVRDDVGYSAELNNGLTLIDLSDRTNPFSFSNQNYPGSFTHNTWLSDSSDFCFTTDETFTGFIRAFDVSDPTDMFETDRIKSTLSVDVPPHNVHVLNDFLVISHYGDGVTLVDASRPDNLAIMGYYDTSPGSGQGFFGCWGAYPFLPSGVVLTTDIQTGLQLFQVNYERQGELILTVLDSATQSPVTAAEISLDGQLIGFTDSQGKISVLIDSTRSSTLSADAAGYAGVAQPTQLLTDQLTEDTLNLVSFARGDIAITLLSAADSLPLAEASLWQEVVVNADTLLSEAKTDSAGQLVQTQISVGETRIVAGKWGYQTVDTSLLTQLGSNDLTLYLPVGYEDDFFFDYDWQIGGAANPNGWERAEPRGSYLPLGALYRVSPDADVSTDLGRKAYITGQGTLNADPEAFDLDGQVSELLSPAFDITGYQEPMLDLSAWIANIDFVQSGGFDQGSGVLRAQVLLGTFPVNLFVLDSVLTNAWLDLDSIPLPVFNQEMYLRFRAFPGADSGYFEAGIDAVRIYDAAAAEDTTTDTSTVALSPATERLGMYLSQQTDREAVIQLERPHQLSGTWSLRLIDIRGAVLFEKPLTEEQQQVRLPFDHPAGVYVAALYQDGMLRALLKLLHP